MINRAIRDKRGEMGVETFFYILMSIVFIWILFFGYQKIFMVQDQISEQDRIEVLNGLKDSFEYCEDPLNRGNVKVVEINGGKYNSLCVIDKNFNFTWDGLNISIVRDDMKSIRDTLAEQERVLVLMDTVFVGNELKRFNIVSSFKIDSGDNFCSFDVENTGSLKARIECN